MEYIFAYLPLCKFKGTVSELPRSSAFFGKSLFFYLLVGFAVQANITEPVHAAIDTIVETLLTLLFISIILYFTKAKHLFVQTATAVFVCNNFIYVLIVPLLVWFTITDMEIVLYLIGVLVFWDVAIVGYILKQLLPYNSFMCLMLSFAFFITVFVGTFVLMLVLF